MHAYTHGGGAHRQLVSTTLILTRGRMEGHRLKKRLPAKTTSRHKWREKLLRLYTCKCLYPKHTDKRVGVISHRQSKSIQLRLNALGLRGALDRCYPGWLRNPALYPRQIQMGVSKSSSRRPSLQEYSRLDNSFRRCADRMGVKSAGFLGSFARNFLTRLALSSASIEKAPRGSPEKSERVGLRRGNPVQR